MRLLPWLACALFCAEVAAQPWGIERSPPRSEPSERSERDNEPWFQRGTTSTPEPAASGRSESPWTPAAREAREPDLARCDRYRVQLEGLLREEMRGRNTGAQQRALHEQRLRDGC
jgi:hypothetical protein